MPDVEKAFKNFAAGLELPREGLRAAIEKSQQVSKWAKQKLKLTRTFLGGSYRRGTDMPLDSLKLHLLLGHKYFYDFNENSTKLLNFLRNRLAEEYRNIIIGEEGMVIRIKSSSAVNLDLLPSFKLTREGYLVPNGYGGWYKTNPGKEETLFKNKDEVSSGKFIKLIKVLKAWNINVVSPFNPYFLELVVYYRVSDFTKPYAELVHSLFTSMRLFLPEFLNCPAVGESISSGVQAGVRQKVVEKAYNLANIAVSERDSKKAVLIWKSLMGKEFGEGKTSV